VCDVSLHNLCQISGGVARRMSFVSQYFQLFQPSSGDEALERVPEQHTFLQIRNRPFRTGSRPAAGQSVTNLSQEGAEVRRFLHKGVGLRVPDDMVGIVGIAGGEHDDRHRFGCGVGA
jgi:hypothetical protein